MSNQPFHNKWHGFNHYTLPLSDFPDSATDPIAGINHPFLGIFYNNIPSENEKTIDKVIMTTGGINYQREVTVEYTSLGPGSSITEFPDIKFNLDPTTKTISSADVFNGGRYSGELQITIKPNPLDTNVSSATFNFTTLPYVLKSDSNYWAYNYTQTKAFSGDWSLFPSVCSTSTTLSSNWWSGYLGYTTVQSNSGYYSNLFTTTSSISSELNYTGAGGDGWHIALSSITWRTNVSAVNTHQKVALPYQLLETNRTLTWYLTAQTAYINLTGDYQVRLHDAYGKNIGGKYTLWVFVDKCPGDTTTLWFNPSVFNIKLKTHVSEYTPPVTEVISLSRNTITRVDFTYDGIKMLGKATHYLLDAKTTDDIYYQGTGITMRDGRTGRQRSSVFVNSAGPGDGVINGRYIAARDAIIKSGQGWSPDFVLAPDGVTLLNRDRSTLSRFSSAGLYINLLPESPNPSLSSLYVAGSGINIRYLDANSYYFSYQLYGASWQTSTTISAFSYLSGSFDRIIGSLSGSSDWQNPAYAQNLIVSPMRSSAPPEIDATLPVDKYNLQTSNLIPVSACTRFYNISVFSGKDKAIENITVNKTSISKSPIIFNNSQQQYNFLNEETTALTFEKIQGDFDIVVTYKFQPGRSIPNTYVWLNPGDNTVIRDLNESLFPSTTTPVRPFRGKLYSNTNTVSGFFIIGPSTSGIVNPSTAPEFVLSGSHRFLRFSPNRLATSSTSLTGLSGRTYFKNFTVTSVFKLNAAPTSNTAVWWLGEYNLSTTKSNLGYGVVIGPNLKLYSRSDTSLKSSFVADIEINKIYVLTSIITTVGTTRTENIFLNGFPVVRNRELVATSPISDTSLYFNHHPQLNAGQTGGSFNLYEYYIFDRALAGTESRELNLFLLDKISKY